MRLSLLLGAEHAAAAARAFRGAAWLDGDGRAGDGRWSFVACEPAEVVRVDRSDAATSAAVARELERGRDPDERRPRWLGYLAYEAGRGIERRSEDARPAAATPDVWWARYDAVACFDHARRRAWIDADDEGAARRLADRLRASSGRPLRRERGGGSGPGPSVRSDTLRTRHLAHVRRALAEIAEGNVYQVNVTRRLEAAPVGDPFALAMRMRSASPVPYGFYLDAGDHHVVGRSPELFLRWERASGRVVTRPIKGTLAHCGARSLAAAGALLRADPKEHAEHVMIVDMARNDLGRVAEIGSVQVPELLVVERFARLDHLVSSVQARVRRGTTLAEVLSATFPGASVTGAPKIAAMDLAAAIETSRRGLYTGAYGLVGADGSLVLAMAIRTAVVRDGSLSYGTGGGIVAASDPEREWQETELKARALLDALAPSPPLRTAAASRPAPSHGRGA